MGKSKEKDQKPESRKRKAEDKSAPKDKSSKKAKKEAKAAAAEPAAATSSLFGVGSASLDPTLSSLFSSAAPTTINPALETRARINAAKAEAKAARAQVEAEESDDDADVELKHVEVTGETASDAEAGEDEVDDEELSELDSDEMEGFDDEDDEDDQELPSETEVAEVPKRRRNKGDDHDDLEAKYLTKLSKEAAKLEKDSKKHVAAEDAAEESAEDAMEVDDEAALDDGAMSPPPQHETLAPEGNQELEKAQNTVFLGNVSTTAITSKPALKTLKAHLTSFFSELSEAAKDEPARSLVSIRFRSTPFASAIPKRAAFAKKEIMDATTHSTNAYAVYSSSSLAREACKRLNGTIVLERHLRVDSVAHPAKQHHKRCIFVGNLGFVDDETFIDAADPHTRHGKKTPSDIEEGLWRTFSQCGTVESVRVVRDAKTRVGKGFAYVQFADENAVEAALLHNDKKFPPLLPRKLRVVRAKPVKRNVVAAKRAREEDDERRKKGGYVKKLTPQEQSQMGRAAKLLGKSAAGAMRKLGSSRGAMPIKAPEAFVFEGHRAKAGSKPAFKTKKGGQKAKPTKSGAKRGAAWKEKKQRD